MKAVLLFILVSTLLVLPCSAEEITFEILQNSQDEYYVEYNDNMIACANDTCTFNVANYTTNTTEFELSRSDIKKIAQYVALEIDIPEYNGSVNESFITNSNIELRNEIIDGVNARNQKHFVPAIEDINACELNLTASQNMIADFKAQAISHEAVLKTKDTEISILKKYNDSLELGAIIMAIGFFFILMTCTNPGKEFLGNIKFWGKE